MFGGGFINIDVTFKGKTKNILIHSKSPLMDILKYKYSITRNIFPYYNNKLIIEGDTESNGIKDGSTIIIYVEPLFQEKLQHDKDKVTQSDTDIELLTKLQHDTELLTKLGNYYNNYNNNPEHQNWKYNLKRMPERSIPKIPTHKDRYKEILNLYSSTHIEYCNSLKEDGILQKLLDLNIMIGEEVNKIIEEDRKDEIIHLENLKKESYRRGESYQAQFYPTLDDIERQKNSPLPKPCNCRFRNCTCSTN